MRLHKFQTSLMALALVGILFFTACNRNEYTPVARTKVSIQLPENYKPMHLYSGFYKDSVQAISVVDLTGGSFESNSQDFNRKSFKEYGLKVYDFQETTVDGYSAKYVITNSQRNDYHIMSMVFGDTSFSVMVHAVFDKRQPEVKDEIKNCLLSAKYDKDAVVDNYKDVNFVIDTSSTQFRHTIYSSGVYLYTPLACAVEETNSQIVLMPQSIKKSTSLSDVASAVLAGFTNDNMFGYMTDSVSTTSRYGASSFLRTGTSMRGTSEMFFQQLIMRKGDYGLAVFGICPKENKHDIEEIKRFFNEVRIVKPIEIVF